MTTPAPRRVLGRISPLSIALLVVVVLMGTAGGAVAGALITGAQIKNGTITSIDIATGGVTGTDVASSTIAGADVKNESLTGADLADEARLFGATGNTTIDTNPTFPIYATAQTTFTTRAGFLQVTAGLDANDLSDIAGRGGLYIQVVVDGNPINTAHYLEFQDEGKGDSTSLSVVTPVSAGSHTVSLRAVETGTGSRIYDRELSILYTSTGTAPVASREVVGRKKH